MAMGLPEALALPEALGLPEVLGLPEARWPAEAEVGPYVPPAPRTGLVALTRDRTPSVPGALLKKVPAF